MTIIILILPEFTNCFLSIFASKIDLRLWRHLDANRLGPLQAGGYFCWPPLIQWQGEFLFFPGEDTADRCVSKWGKAFSDTVSKKMFS